MRIAHAPSSSARGMTVRVLHKANIMGAVLSLCVLVAWVSANPSAELFVQLGHSNHGQGRDLESRRQDPGLRQ